MCLGEVYILAFLTVSMTPIISLGAWNAPYNIY